MSKQNIDLTGRRFGRVIAESFTLLPPPGGMRAWVCKCDCGATVTIRQWWLLRGKKTSCGCLRRQVRLNPDEYFWPLVSGRDDPDACWEWQGRRTRSGYGQFQISYRNHGTHRHAWEIAKGQPVPAGMSVCHRCDNPPCCNPRHLFIGTARDNLHDARQKGRWRPSTNFNRKGSESPQAKLTEEDVRAIRERYDGRRGFCVDVAKEFSVGRTTIQKIVSGTTWRHVAAYDAAKGGR